MSVVSSSIVGKGVEASTEESFWTTLSCLETGSETSSFVWSLVKGDCAVTLRVFSGVFCRTKSCACFDTFAFVSGNVSKTRFCASVPFCWYMFCSSSFSFNILFLLVLSLSVVALVSSDGDASVRLLTFTDRHTSGDIMIGCAV